MLCNRPDVSGTKHIENFYKGVVETHGSAKYLSKSCTSKYGASLMGNQMPQSVLKMVEGLGYFQASCNHLNPVISSLKDEQYSQEGPQYCFRAVTISLMMTSFQCR
ncbi:hypothetical protein Ahy_B04g071667 [Arachis hypogaea]|uniref:Uncharacterized protein n=1 Tax=Arachis hypogaea TaxID=3818 RepID=A0A444ZLB2_ARAHY|nr:hypothetical protein Ahy_B04g071667 [Arachis hypogaea]